MRFRLYAYAAVLAAGAASVVAVNPSLSASDSSRFVWQSLPVLVVILAGVSQLRLRFRRADEVISLTLFEAVLAPLIFAFPPLVVVAAVAVAQFAISFARRGSWGTRVFNVAEFALAAAVGSVLYGALISSSVGVVYALVIALVSVAVVNFLALSGALAITRQRVSTRSLQLGSSLLFGWVVGSCVNVLMGVLFVLAYQSSPLSVLLLPLPLYILHHAYRGYAAARTDRQRFAGLRTAAQSLALPLNPHEAIANYLVEVAGCFEAGGAALILHTEQGHLEIHSYDGEQTSVRREPSDKVALECVVAGQFKALYMRASEAGELGELMAKAGWRRLMSAPVVNEQRRLGTVVVFNQGGIEGNVESDLSVLDTLSRETAQILARGELVEQILTERHTLTQIVDNTSDGIFTLAEDGSAMTWNLGCERIMGLTAADVLGTRDALKRVSARTSAGIPIDFAGWTSEPSLPAEVIITRPDGETRRLSCSSSRAVEGTEQNLVVVARDITPAEKYQELEEQFRRLVEVEAAQRLVVDHLQQAVAPEPPGIDGTEIAVAYVASDPSSPTGGDLFDWHLLPSGELHIAVVDVLGHGVEATKEALAVIHALRFAAVDGTPLTEMVERADALLHSSEVVATVVVCRYDPDTGDLRVASGGHPPALRVRADGDVAQLAASGGAIGWPGAGSENVTTTSLNVNDSLVLYTDGLVEARKDILEGLERLSMHAADLCQQPAQDLANELVERSLAGGIRRDDTLALVLRRTQRAEMPRRARWEVTPGSAQSLQAARHDFAGWLSEHKVRVDDALMVVGELLANAVVSARSHVVLVAEMSADAVVIDVSDDGHGDTSLDDRGQRLPVVGSERGWGLFVIRSLAEDVSIMSSDEGTVVRCTVPIRHQARETPTLRERFSGRR